jgi:hypothetical protein
LSVGFHNCFSSRNACFEVHVFPHI